MSLHRVWDPAGDSGPVRSAARAWQRAAVDLDDHFDGLGRVHANRTAHWSGEASQVEAAAFAHLAREVGTVIETLRSTGRQLDSVAHRIDTTNRLVHDAYAGAALAAAAGACLAVFTFGASEAGAALAESAAEAVVLEATSAFEASVDLIAAEWFATHVAISTSVPAAFTVSLAAPFGLSAIDHFVTFGDPLDGWSFTEAGADLAAGAIGFTEARLGQPDLELPYGFRNRAEFKAFLRELDQGLVEQGLTDVTVAMQGSSVTGVKFTTGEWFDAGRVSDLDVGLASPDLFERARDLGVPLRGRGSRTAPLTSSDIEHLGLGATVDRLQEMAGRPVAFMVFPSVGVATAKGPTVLSNVR